ncbi:MAG: tryptophan--tRNA ligase, partial [Planctomycetes bacterium]|nr:tryptophan--tRNA ligase [Planctomycetota bacterium]
LYKAVAVPVGEDQVQHIELSREIARKFNVRFPRPSAGGVFPDPQHLLSPTPRIMGLDGKTKMSKSLNNYIGMLDEPDTIRLKLRTAFTVESRLRRSDPGNPDICNIFTLHKSFTPPDVVARIYEDSKSAKLGCVDCKKMLAENMIRELTPIREKARDLMANPDRVRAILAAGAARCKSLAAETMREAKQVMGLA